jgi:hypothetical protein
MLIRKWIVAIQFRNVVSHCEEEKILDMHEGKMLRVHSDIGEIIGYNGSYSLALYFLFIYGLFNPVSSSGYIALNGRMISE